MSHGAVSPESTTRRPGRASPITSCGDTPPTVSPACSRPKSGPGATPSAAARLGVEAARALGLDDRVAERAPAVAHVERLDVVPVELDRVTGVHVGDLQVVGDPAPDAGHRRQQPLRPGRAEDVERLLATPQVERLQHPRQPEPVVGVVVREEDGVEIGETDAAQQLALGPLAAVEQQPVTVEPREHGRQAAPGGGHRGARSGEEQLELVHLPRAYRRSPGRYSPRPARASRDAARARSSVDRAPASGAGGQRFESSRARPAGQRVVTNSATCWISASERPSA